MKRKRPKVVSGKTYKIHSSMGTVYITINEDDNGPLEVFLRIGKNGNQNYALTEAIGRLISVSLQYGVPVEVIIKQLKNIHGSDYIVDGNLIYYSIPDAIGKILELHIEQNKDKQK